jgi:hypothetical protein
MWEWSATGSRASGSVPSGGGVDAKTVDADRSKAKRQKQATPSRKIALPVWEFCFAIIPLCRKVWITSCIRKGCRVVQQDLPVKITRFDEDFWIWDCWACRAE